jgi:hypothetical protein
MSALVLITGTEIWAVEQVAQALRRQGHRVVRLDERPERRPDGADGSWTVDGTPVDLVLTVRAHPVTRVVRAEQAVARAQLAGVPVLVAGATMAHPFGDEVDTHEGLDGLAAAVERAVGARRPHRRRTLSRA